MYEDQAAGTAKKVVGKVEDAAGGLFGDEDLQAQGKVRQAVGTIQDSYGKALDQVTESTRVNPIGALLVAVGVGFVLGKVL